MISQNTKDFTDNKQYKGRKQHLLQSAPVLQALKRFLSVILFQR